MSDESTDPTPQPGDGDTVEAEIVEEVPPSAEPEPDEIVVDEDGTVREEPVTVSGSGEVPQEKVVYVTTPAPPKPRSNRIPGVILALLGAVGFAVLYALVGAVVVAIGFSDALFGPVFRSFLGDASFWVPILFFALGFVLMVLLLNRAAWWLHVLASLAVAAVTYLGTVGVLLLIRGIVGDAVSFSEAAGQPLLVAAGLVAREVAIWVGLAIARRGQRVRRRNAEEREAFEREHAAPAA